MSAISASFSPGQPAFVPVLHHHGASSDHDRVVCHQHAPQDKGTPTPIASVAL